MLSLRLLTTPVANRLESEQGIPFFSKAAAVKSVSSARTRQDFRLIAGLGGRVTVAGVPGWAGLVTAAGLGIGGCNSD
jgi:hypothetical protein